MATLAERRAELLAKIPPRYSGAVHLLGINLVSLAAIAAFAAQVRAPTWLDAALVPAALAFANVFEWWIHKGPLHHKTRLLGSLYERHARSHHVAFTDDRMAIEAARELKLVLFPAFVLPLMLLMVSPLAGGLYLLRPNLAWLFLASAMGYYLLYEWLHLLHHLPPESWIGRRRIVRALRRHHLAHHDPARMTKGNFNVSFPFADWLLRSTLPAQAAVAEPAEVDAGAS